MEKYSDTQFCEIGHTLGIDVPSAKLSKQKEDKTLPEKFFRNYYNYGKVKPNHTEPIWITGLSSYIERWKQFGAYYFKVNKKGIDLFRKQFKEEVTDKYVPLSRSKQKYQDYLSADTGESFAEYLGIII